MRILALETSTREASVALLERDRLVSQTILDSGQRTASGLAPAMAEQLRVAGWRASELDLILVSQGPGSFTGLRVGVTAAKTLAYAVGAAVLGVNTLEVIAHQVDGDWPRLDVVMNAQRQQVFAACYRCRGAIREVLEPPRILDDQAWLDSLALDASPGGASGDEPTRLVTGAGLSRLRAHLPDGVRVASPDGWSPRAVAVGRLGFHLYRAGRRDDLWKLAPHYFRPSAAEEVWETQGKGAR